MKKILITLLTLKFLLFVWPGLAYADGFSVNGRWLDYFEEGDSYRTEQGVVVTTRVPGEKAGAFVKTGLLKWDFNNSSVTFRVKVSDWKEVSTLSLIVGNGTKFERAATIDIKTRIINPSNNEWLQINAPFSAWSIEGDIDWTKIDNVLFSVADKGNERITAQLSGLVVQKQPSLGAISITIDDGLVDTITAADLLAKRNVAGTAFIDVDTIGQPGYISESDVQRLIDSGWQIGGHRIGRLSQLSQPELSAHVERTYGYLTQHAIKTFEYALPNGARSEAITQTLSERFTYIHNIDGMSNDGYSAIPTNINRHSIDKHTSLALAKTWVDAAKRGEWVVINFHTFSDTWIREEDWSVADVEALLDYVIEQQVPIITTAEAVKRFEPQKVRWWR